MNTVPRSGRVVMWVLTAALVVCPGLSGCARRVPSSPGQDQVGLPQYSILDEKVYDEPGKTQVRQDILVSGQISEAGLRTLLGQLYSGIMARRGFRYSKAPTNVYIYAFTSPERARSGQWIAMLWKHRDTGPTIDVFEGELSQLGAPDEERFGLSEDERKEIWWEVGLAGKEMWEECERLYPEWEHEIWQCLDTLWDRIIADVAKRYDLSVEQLEEIGEEARREFWTAP